ncbi:MAG: EamA family transporter, partial [Flavisolibacter sp.]
IISGVLLLFIGNGAVIWSEKTLPSSLVAVLVSSSPLWFVLFDKSKWKENFSNKATVAGLITGFAGVILLFGHQVSNAFSSNGSMADVIGISILMIGSISWAVGSLYSKHYSTGSNMVNTAWQMLVGGIAFIPGSLLNKEWATFSWNIPTETWLSVAYLIFFGSLAAYTAYVWLLQVRPATQVSTYAYVNPVVAVLIGVFFGGEKLNTIQVTGLLIILTSVLLINMAKRRNAQKNTNAIKPHYTEKHDHIEKEKIALSE